MHLFHSRTRRHDRHPHAGWGGRFGAFWHAAFHHPRGFHHPHAHHPHHPHADGWSHTGFAERLQSRAAAFLDLDETQSALMDHLFQQLRTARRAAKAVARGTEVAALVETETFRRDDAQALFDARIEALKAAGPGAIAAFGDFFDALDFEQQQMLRFALRRRGGRGRWGRGDGADHDA